MTEPSMELEECVRCELEGPVRKRRARLQTLLENLAASRAVPPPPGLLAAVLLLTHELTMEGPWNQENFTDLAQQIEAVFTGDDKVSLASFVKQSEQRQAIFDSCLATLHKKLKPEEWKTHSASIEVYCKFLNEIDDVYQSGIVIDPVKVLPAALLLIDDFEPEFKRKGLQSCRSVLKCLNVEDFHNSNYQQVIHQVLSKLIQEKDLDILKNAFDCMELLLPLLPVDHLDGKWNEFDEMLKSLVENIYLETNVERKSVCFDFLSKFITIRRIDCARLKKSFNAIICDNLDLCTGDNTRCLLLRSILLALRTWLTYCWGVWRYEPDKKIIQLMFKILYVECLDDKTHDNRDEIKELIICMMSLCTRTQQRIIVDNLQEDAEKIDNKIYREILKSIIKAFS